MATAADILGLNHKPKIAPRWATHYRELCRLRDDMEERDNKSPEGSPVKLDDLADAGSYEVDRGLAWTTQRAGQAMLGEIVAAIRRIETNTYGQCEVTGQPIEPERLKATPWVRCALEGQLQLEREGLLSFARIPGLQPMEDIKVAGSEDDDEAANDA